MRAPGIVSGNAATVRIDADYSGRSAREAREMWAWGASPVYSVTPLNADATCDDYDGKVWHTGRFAVTRLKFPAQAFDHGRRNQALTGGYISLQKILSGRARGQAGGAPIDQRAGSIHAIDYDRPYRGVHDATELCGIFIPRELAGFGQQTPAAALRFDTGSASSRILQREFDLLIRHLEAGSLDLLPHLQRIASVLAVCANGPETGDRQRELAAAARRDALDALIEERLGEFDLTPDRIARDFGISRATLYRLYDGEGGVRAYIRERRLCRAVAELAAAPPDRGAIHRSAEKWGFSSDSVFNRSVRRHFGLTPGSIIGSSVQPSAQNPPMISRWLFSEKTGG